MAVPALENGNESIIDRLKAEGQLTRNSGTNSLKVVISQLKDISLLMLVYGDAISTALRDQYDLAQDQNDLARQKDATQKFQKDETESESDRFKGMKEVGGKIVEQTKKGAEAIGGFVSKLLRALAAPALLALLAFLPEILDSKLFKEALKFAEETLVPLLISFKDNILLPIANFFKNGFTQLLTDLNDPEMSFGDVFKDNIPIIAASLAILLRKQIVGIALKAIPAIFGVIGTLITAAAAVLNPVGLIILAVAAVVGILYGVFKLLDPEKQEAIKAAIKEKGMAAKKSIIELYDTVVLGFKRFLVSIVPDVLGLRKKAADVLGVDLTAMAIASAESKIASLQKRREIGGQFNEAFDARMNEEIEEKRKQLEDLKEKGAQFTVAPTKNEVNTAVTNVSNSIKKGVIDVLPRDVSPLLSLG